MEARPVSGIGLQQELVVGRVILQLQQVDTLHWASLQVFERELLRAIVALTFLPLRHHFCRCEPLETRSHRRLVFGAWSRGGCREQERTTGAGIVPWRWAWQLGRACRQQLRHGKPLLIGTSQCHGLLQRRRVLQFNVGLQRVAQPRRKDVDLVFLSQPVAAGEEGEKFPLILRHRAFTP
jgi:hypothetical protein